jgi:hypothetical protein
MDIQKVIDEARNAGVSLSSKNGGLVVRVRKNKLSDELRKLLTNNKTELIRYLTGLIPHENEVLNSKGLTKILPRGDVSHIPASWAQQRLWFIAQLEGGNAAYHIPGSVRLGGDLCRSSVENALTTIVNRHEALRTVFKEIDGDVRQEILPADESSFDLEYRNLGTIKNLQSALQTEADEVNQTPFDLASGPMIRCRLIQLSEKDHVLLIAMHHIVSDGWSMGILIREFNALYD